MDENKSKYGYYTIEMDDYRMRPKTCPLTRERVDPVHHDYDCLKYNCNGVEPDKWSLLYGRRYRCGLERDEIERWHERQLKAAKMYRRLNDSYESTRKINVDEFFEYCDKLDKEMIESRQQYAQDMVISPYHDPEDKCLLYLFENDELVEISVAENIFAHIGRRFDQLRSDKVKCEISCCAVPGYMAEAISVRLHLEHKMDVKAILHNDNPVYIKARGIAKYIDAVYGWDWLEFKKVRDQHLEMTEIVSYDNIIYIKQELDEIIRRK